MTRHALLARNPLLDRLQAGHTALGLSLRLATSPNMAEMAATCGFHWLFIDLEHGPMGYDTACAMMDAGLRAGVTPIVRVPGHDASDANRALTNGALGIIYPHVDDAGQALACARTARFAPDGIRGVPAVFPQLGFDKPTLADAVKVLNAITCVVVMIESAAAVENAEQIAAQPGVDVLFVGASDLSVEMGLPGDYQAAPIREALDHVAAAARAQGCFAGLGGIGDLALLGDLVKAGYQMLLAGNDLDFFMQGAKARAGALNSLR